MEIIIFIIFIIFAIVKASEKQNNINRNTQNRTNGTYVDPRSYQAPNNTRGASVPNQQRQGKTAAQLKDEIWERLSEESKAKMLNRGTSASVMQSVQSAPKKDEELTTSQQIHKRRIENRTTSILERAKDNTEAHAEDVTLNTLEAEHNHSERVSAAVHHHPEDVIPENLLGSVEDLMVKGYDGNLCFERDFVGEAMDMINRFTVPSEV